jgi:3-deoxy-D-arabino-heptulosonate 7-phosphate (DAHP) synthase class II
VIDLNRNFYLQFVYHEMLLLAFEVNVLRKHVHKSSFYSGILHDVISMFFLVV